MNLRGKLVLIQAPFFVAIALMALVSVVAVTNLGAKSQEILKDNYRSVLAAQRMDEAVERLDDVAVGHLLGAGAGGLAEGARVHFETFERELAVEEANITEPGERDLAARVRGDWSRVRTLFGEMQAIKERPELAGFYSARLMPALSRVRAGSAEILGLNQDAMVRKSDRTLAASRRLQLFMLACWALATVAALTSAWFMTRRLIRPLTALQQAVKRVGEGDLAARATPEGKDEVAMLAQDFNAMAERLQQYRRSSLGELLAAQQAAQASIDSLPEPIIIFGTTREVISVNRSTEKLLGRIDSLADLDPQLASLINRVLDHVFEGKGAYLPRGLDETVRVKGPNGEHYLLPTANPLRDEEGTAIGVTLGLQDVTRFKRFDELKDDMVSTVAHEFRTPLTSIRMAIHICLEEIAGPLTPKQNEMLSAAREECERLQVLVDDLLDLSRLQKGVSPASPEPVAASALLGNAVARRRDDAQAAGVKLSQRLSGEDVRVLADQGRIATVFDNLIANALRYSPKEGEITVSAAPEGAKVRFEVADQGPGIPREHLERLFERMYQVPGAEGGARGLGLSIVREIVLAHGGEVGVRSEPGNGSIFWFTLNREKEGEG